MSAELPPQAIPVLRAAVLEGSGTRGRIFGCRVLGF